MKLSVEITPKEIAELIAAVNDNEKKSAEVRTTSNVSPVITKIETVFDPEKAFADLVNRLNKALRQSGRTTVRACLKSS